MDEIAEAWTELGELWQNPPPGYEDWADRVVDVMRQIILAVEENRCHCEH